MGAEPKVDLEKIILTFWPQIRFRVLQSLRRNPGSETSVKDLGNRQGVNEAILPWFL